MIQPTNKKLLRVVRAGTALALLVCLSCKEVPKIREQVTKPKPVPTEPSKIDVDIKPGGPVIFTTPTAIFEIQPSGYTKASLRKGSELLTLDDPMVGAPAGSDFAIVNGKEVHFSPEFDQARELEAIGKLGSGKRVEMPSHLLGHPEALLERRIAIEAYDRFPNVAIATVEYRNAGNADVKIERIVVQRHRFTSKVGKEPAQQSGGLEMYSGVGQRELRQGVITLPAKYSSSGDAGADAVPVVAFWNRLAGEGLADLDLQQKSLAIPVRAEPDARVATEVRLPGAVVKPGETLTSQRTLLIVFEGDYHAPLEMWSEILQAEGIALPEAAQRELIKHGIGSPHAATELKAPAKAKSKSHSASSPSKKH